MILVSRPERRLLVSSTRHDNHETTLVVADLPRPSVEYFKCLVDGGRRFEEHAVVVWQGAPPDRSTSELLLRALTAARPTEVTLFGDECPMQKPDGSPASPSGAAACAVASGLDVLDKRLRGRFLGLDIEKSEQFFVCRPGSKSPR